MLPWAVEQGVAQVALLGTIPSLNDDHPVIIGEYLKTGSLKFRAEFGIFDVRFFVR